MTRDDSKVTVDSDVLRRAGYDPTRAQIAVSEPPSVAEVEGLLLAWREHDSEVAPFLATLATTELENGISRGFSVVYLRVIHGVVCEGERDVRALGKIVVAWHPILPSGPSPFRYAPDRVAALLDDDDGCDEDET